MASRRWLPVKRKLLERIMDYLDRLADAVGFSPALLEIQQTVGLYTGSLAWSDDRGARLHDRDVCLGGDRVPAGRGGMIV